MDPLHQLGRGRRAPVADAHDRREVVVVEAGRLDDPPHDRRDTTEARDLLAFDRRHRRVRVEPARGHQDELGARRVAEHHRRQASGHVEEGHDEQRRGLHLARQFGRSLAAAAAVRDAEAEDVLQVREGLAVRERGALRPPCGARRVQDREQVIFVDVVGRQRPRVVAEQQLAAGPGDTIGFVQIRHEYVLELRQRVHSMAHRLPPLRVAEQQLGARVAQSELELVGLPPRVQWHDHGADRRRRPPQHHPLDVVRRDDGDAVAVADAQLPERCGDATNLRVVLVVGQTTIALDEEVDAGAPVRHRDQLAQRVQPVLVHLERDAQDVLGDDLERAARPRELGEDGILESGRDLVDGHRGSGVLTGASSCWITSKDHSSLPVPTGPPPLWALCPCWKAGLLTHAWNSSSDRQRV